MCTLHPAKHSYISERCRCIAGPPDGHLPDSADQDSAATAREAHVRFGESAQGIPEAPPRVVTSGRRRVNNARQRRKRTKLKRIEENRNKVVIAKFLGKERD